MSLEAVWDLHTRAGGSSGGSDVLSPRSVCIYSAPTTAALEPSSTSLNPFDMASGGGDSSRSSSPQTPHAVVFGSEQGSLHYRTYPSPNPSSSGTGSSNSSSSQLQPPLGVTPSGRPPMNLPRGYFPVDLPRNSLPGPVVGIVPAKSVPGHSSQQFQLQLLQRPVFLVLVDDNRGSSHQGGAYAATFVTLQHGAFNKLTTPPLLANLPRVSCATYHTKCGFVLCGGKRLLTIPPTLFLEDTSAGSSSTLARMVGGGKQRRGRYSIQRQLAMATIVDFSATTLPPPGARGGQDSLIITANGHVAIIAIGSTVFALPGLEVDLKQIEEAGSSGGKGDSLQHHRLLPPGTKAPECFKVMSFGQSSQIHPVIIIDIQDRSMDPDWYSLLLANGRECAVVDIQYDSHHNSVSAGSPRNGTVTLASPILAAASSWPFLTLLTSDGLISLRSPSCLAVPLRTIEVGTRPNDFFSLKPFRELHLSDVHSFNNNTSSTNAGHTTIPWILCMSYSGEAKVLQCRADTSQDLADRLMRLSIDAFGSGGFPRNQLAEALNASFTSTSYAGPEPTPQSRNLLRQYLEAILGLTDFEGGASSGWPTELKKIAVTRVGGGGGGSPTSAAFPRGFGDNTSNDRGGPKNSSRVNAESSPVVTEAYPNALLTATALLCLVCTQLTPSPKGSLANRAAKACAAKMGVVILGSNGISSEVTKSSIEVNEIVAERLLKEASQVVSLLNANNSSSSGGMSKRNSGYAQATLHMEFVEAATWLLRSCGRHERAIEVLYQRLQQHRSPESAKQPIGFWSQIKYESYTATHLSELWGTNKEAACQLVLDSKSTVRLLENNPRLGLNVFTVNHPQNASQWKRIGDREDPLAHPKYPSKVVQLLKSINPAVPYIQENTKEEDEDILPMNSGRALTVTFLESAIGISTNRPKEEDEFDALKSDEYMAERIADFHDELCYLLLEGVISERGDQDNPQSDAGEDGDATAMGKIYRNKLRRLLRWPLAKMRSERLLNSLPKSFKQEQALVLGRLGRHEEALKILYCDCKSIDLALEYCDMLHERRENRKEKERARLASSGMLDDRTTEELDRRFEKENAYLPLIRVALETDSDKKRGTASAIQILALRRNEIDRTAALRLLPNNVPVSAVARPFLIPALVDSESQARRLKVVSSLLRARHTALKQQLTDAQLKAQANLHVVPQLRSMNLGEPIHSTKPFKARPSSSASSTFPDVVIVKHFFPRHVIIQAKVSNNSYAVDGRALGNIAFVVAESSEEAIQPSTQVPIKVLPFKASGCAWCVLLAAPNRMEGTAILTCELRYTVLGVDATSGTPISFGGQGTSGRTFVEELQDIEVFASHFS
ncbi:coatomer gamma subunit appendage platform subdomain containing protein [Nitzschia inconspicua]|uniref:Coatomer gamma subunit appendage platform subdomain containing protein n=1 Tax=Nitzschia inconspicua TaxID=303405 RepID=A0A9K3LW69_9STRA|nr:coatomer gamma subunit appendage platform subdomain containing protein [Nitzschia inconspicua]